MGAAMSVIWADSAIGGRMGTAAAVVEACRETGSRAALPHAGQAMPGAAINSSERGSFRSTAPSPIGKAGGGSGRGGLRARVDWIAGGATAACARLGRGLARALAAGLLLAAAALLLPAAPAEAQTEQTLVTNMSETASTAASTIMSQGFTTGSASGGYTLTSIGLRFDDANTTLLGVDLLVRIFTTNSDGTPNTLVHTLTSPSSISTTDVNLFTAPSGATLDASTNYAVFLTNAAADGRVLGAMRTASSSDSSDRTDGWSIANIRHWKVNATDDWTESSTLLYIEVKGYATSSIPADTTVTQTAGGATWTLTGPDAVTAGRTYTYTMTLASGTKPSNEYAGFYLPNSATNQDTLGTDPDNCVSPKNFCASFVGELAGQLA